MARHRATDTVTVTLRLFSVVVLVFSLVGCPSRVSHNEAAREESQPSRIKPTARLRTLFEHRDHRDLPVGTKIYYDGPRESILRPGDPTPAGRPADIEIVK